MTGGITVFEPNPNIRSDPFSSQEEFKPSIPEQPKQGRRERLEFWHVAHEDTGSKESVQEYKPLDSVFSTFNPENIMGVRQLPFIKGQAIGLISRAYIEDSIVFQELRQIPP